MIALLLHWNETVKAVADEAHAIQAELLPLWLVLQASALHGTRVVDLEQSVGPLGGVRDHKVDEKVITMRCLVVDVFSHELVLLACILCFKASVSARSDSSTTYHPGTCGV